MERSDPICVLRCWAVISLVALFALPCMPQKLDASRQQAVCLDDLDIQSGNEARYRALREFEDPATHQHWLLIRDRSRATGPALFVKQWPHSTCVPFDLGKVNSGLALRARVHSVPVIHPGDQIVLIEHTIVSDAELEATALGEAAVGDSLLVRIKYGGLTVRAIAAARSTATLGFDARERQP
jgi:hypothetical protein